MSRGVAFGKDHLGQSECGETTRPLCAGHVTSAAIVPANPSIPGGHAPSCAKPQDFCSIKAATYSVSQLRVEKGNFYVLTQ